MKAIILAGGEGTRLRPMTCRMPKPMVRMFDKPVMEHIINLLKRNEITDIAATLMYLPYTVTDYFSDGSEFGVTMTYYMEKEPLGTAGGVRQCESFYGNEDVLVISGDAVCDFDLKQAIAFHKMKNADATILLYRHPTPLEYGIVMTDSEGHIERFVEKPVWGQVFTDLVNTGVYILSPNALSRIPQNTIYDFSKELFPAMLAEKAALYGYEATGYWCDMGDCSAYLRCMEDALSGLLRLEWGDQMDKPVDGIEIQGNCYISKGAKLRRGTLIGPGAVLHDGADIGPGTMIEGAVCGGTTGAGCRINGAIIDRGAVLGDNCVLEYGCVAGPGAHIGSGSLLGKNVRVWPEVTIDKGSQITASVAAGGKWTPKIENGRVIGEDGIDITPELCLRLGAALGDIAKGKILLSGGPEWTAAAISAGMSSAGAKVYRADCGLAAAASFTGTLYGMDMSVHAEKTGRQVEIFVYGKDGLALPGIAMKKIASLLARGTTPSAVGDNTEPQRITGCDILYVSQAAKQANCKGITVGAPKNSLLARALTEAGAKVADGALPAFKLCQSGFGLKIADEKGNWMDEEHALMLIAAASFLSSPGSRIAVSYDAPAVMDELAAKTNGTLLRTGRDRDAEAIYAAEYAFRHGLFGAVKLCGILIKHGIKIYDMQAGLPQFYRETREISCSGDRSSDMRILASACADAENVNGIRIRSERGWAHVTPSSVRESLRVTIESAKAEFAGELYADVEKILKQGRNTKIQ